MTTVNKYRIYCIDDSKWEYTWGETPPTTCPTNTAHAVNAGSVSIIDEVKTESVQINEVQIPAGSQPTGGFYRIKSQAFDAPASSTTTSTFSFPYPVAVISGYIKTDDSMRGDVLSVGVGYDTTLGLITANVTTGDTAINVNHSAVTNYYMRVGGFLRLTNGVVATPYYEIVSKNTSTDVVTIRTGVDQDFLSSVPTYVQIAVIFADNIEFGCPDQYAMGISNIGASYVPANLVFRITYTNNGEASKRPVLVYDIYY